MNPTTIRIGLAVLALVACKDREPKMPKVSQVFPTLPLPLNPTIISKSGSPDALQLTVRSASRVKDVEGYYRTMLNKDGWKLTNDMRDKDGSLVLLAERDGPPLWVRIKSAEDSLTTLVELNGAVLAGGAKPEKPAS